MTKKQITLEELSLLLGYERSTLRRKTDEGSITLEMADRILCKINYPEAWRWPELIPFYYEGAEIPPDPTKPVKCALQECDQWFEIESLPAAGPCKTGERTNGWKLYCSKTCAHRARNTRYRSSSHGRAVNRRNASRDYYKHRERRLAAQKARYEKNKEQRKADMRRYRARKKLAEAA